MAEAKKDAPGSGQIAGMEKGTSDDKCMGNRKVRTIFICACLFGFSLFAAGYLLLIVDRAKDEKESGCAGNLLVDCGLIDSLITGANCIWAGMFFIMFFSVVTSIVACIPTCNPSKNIPARLPALGLLLGAGLYIFGWVYYISKHKEMYYEFLPSDDAQEDQDAMYLAWFGEAIVYAATTVLLAVDLLIPSQFLMEDEFKRLFLNMGLLAVASIFIMPAYFVLSKENSVGTGPSGLEFGREGAAVIGAGYIIIFLASITYIIVYVLTCCAKCNLKDTCAFRVALCLTLMAGGVITSIGYWIFSGEGLGEAGDEAKGVAYYVGYTGLIGGLCFIWAVDVAW
eukprot:CAMPEP_0197032384 /NCGR_PEP_ID=MMETSP1384-20130603/11072_1 /TAXON_ID=29189 /ORGANISM="Ammonia sp." /LENGTH=339 /DNA_ID=CAMNT_0042462033 /DNA_START=44 /DNA_END=1060 /DNA_ORIENTATION=-